jgi:hypothetical protein
MEAGPALARQMRARHRHELRTLTYVTLDQANGGIVRNLSHDGIAVQAVAAVRPRQQLRVRFDLRYPRLRVETRGEVVWSTFSGQCGIRFLDLPPRLLRQIDEWIFGDLLEGLSIPSERAGSIFVDAASSIAAKSSPAFSNDSSEAAPLSAASARVARELEAIDLEPKKPVVIESLVESPVAAESNDLANDGLTVSPAPMKVIKLRPPAEPFFTPAPSPASAPARPRAISTAPASHYGQLDWLSQPLSGRSLAWTINTLVVVAASLLFGLIFLSVNGEAPKWPVTMTTGGAIVVAGLYWGFFKMFGGSSLGVRLARLAGSPVEELEEGARFR